MKRERTGNLKQDQYKISKIRMDIEQLVKSVDK